LVEGGVAEIGVAVAPKCSCVTWSEVLISTPAPTIWVCEPPLFAIIQRWFADDAHRKSRFSAESEQVPSKNFTASPCQARTSLASLKMHRFAVFAWLRQQIWSEVARRRIPVVAGVEDPVMNVPMKVFPVFSPAGLPGTWSTENSTSAGAQLAPSFCRQSTNL
jgi:hypothetical protein